jgi:gliding motility-associated-like protein
VADPIIGVEPQATQSICVGGTIPTALAVTVTGGTGTVTYQWLAGTNQLSGATQSTFLPSIFTTPGTFTYTANISISGVGCNALTSQPAQVIVVDDPSVSQPLAAVYCQNATPITPLQVNVTGGLGSNAYQWYFSTANATGGGTAIVGANSSSYVPSVATVGTAYYYCIVNQSGPNCATTSVNASIQVNLPPTISLQPIASQTLCEGGAPTILQVAYINGTNSATYQWYTNNTNSTIGGTPISNATTASYNPQSTILGTTYYYCVITFQQGGCTSLTSIAAQVTIVGDPAITTQPLANQEICQGNTINNALTFSYTGGTGTSTIAWYLDATPPVLINGVTTNSYLPIPFNIADTFSYFATLSYSGVGCDTDSTQLAEIIVHPTPYATNLNDTLVVCNHSNLNIPLTATVTSTFNWQTQLTTAVNGESFLPQTSYSIDDSLSNTTTSPQFLAYTVTPTSFPYGCVGPDSTVVVQLQPDVILSMNPTIEICSGSPVNGILTSNIPSTFNWFVSIDNPNVTGESILPSTNWLINDVLVNDTSVNQIVLYSVFPVSIQGQCPGLAQPLVVTVKPPIDLLNPDSLTICSGQNVGINLVANTNVNFNWYASPSLNVSGETTSVVSSPLINDVLVNPTNVIEVVTYNVIGTSTANGCSSPVIPLYVVVNPIPSLVNLNPLTICNGNYLFPYSLQTSVVGATTNWAVLNNPIGIPSTFGSNTLPGFIATNNTIITQTGQILITPIYTNNNVTCIGNDTTLLIPVLPTPSVNPIADITACNLTQIPLTPVNGPVPNTVFEWYNANVSLGLNASGIGNIPTFVGLNNTTIPVTGTVTVAPSYTQNNITCQGNPIDFEITVNPSPTLLNSNIEICDGEFTNILLNANIPSTFQWNATIQANVYNETAAPVQNTAYINDQLVLATTTAQIVTYNVTPISAPYGCIGFDTTILVQVNPLPIVDFSVITPILCDQSQINFQNNSVGSLDFTWSFGDGDSSFLFNPVHEYANFGSYLVTLEAVDQLTGCFNDAAQTIIINENPDADFIISDTLACGSLDVTFNALDLNPNWSYLWTFGDGTSSNQYGLAGHQYVTNGCFDINLQISSPEGCISDTTQLDAVCIYPEPIAAFTMDDPVVSSLTPEVQFFNSSLYADSYLWEFGDGNTSQTENPSHLFPPDPATYVIILTASNNVGCQDTAALSVTIWQDLAIYVPNTFTPDDDEYNQTFKPVLTDGFKKDSYHMTIFNRWGEIVFESRDLEYGWDGSYSDFIKGPCAEINGQGYYKKVMTSPDGTYTWKIEVTELQSGEVRKFLGHVNLIR